MGKKLPTHEIKLGNIRATIWENRTEGKGAWFNVTLSRLYKDGNEWKDSSSFRRDDLLFVNKATDMAFNWIWQQEQRDASQKDRGQ